MRVMHVAHIKARAFTAETTGTERRQSALVRQFVQRIGLLHELRQLRTAKKLAHRRHNRADVDEIQAASFAQGREYSFVRGPHVPGEQTNTQVILDQLAHRFDAAIAQMINIIVVLETRC